MIKMPILLEGHTLTPRATLHPVSLQIQLREQPLSTSTMQLTRDDVDVQIGDWVLVMTPQGDQQPHMVRSIQTDYNTGLRTVSCEHVWSVTKDNLIYGEMTPSDMGGSEEAASPMFVMWALLQQQTEHIWQAGVCTYDTPQGWTFNNTSIFDGFNSLINTMLDSVLAFDTRTLPFTVNIVRRSTDVRCEMRCNRNLSSMRMSVDRNGMATRIYPEGDTDVVLNGLPYVQKNIDRYGVISRVLKDPSIKDKGKLREWAEQMLERTAVPQVSISISGLELSQATGEPLDRLTVGTVCRVPLPDDGIVIEQRITDISWANALTDPMAVTITLANNRDTVQGVLRKINQNNTQLNNGLAGAKKLAGEAMTKSDTRWTEFQQTMTAIKSGAYWIDNKVSYMTELIQTANSLEGVAAQYNYDDSGDLLGAIASKFVFKAGNVSLNLTSTDFNGQQVMGAINAYIKGDKSHLKMDFDAIEFDGHVDFVNDATFGKGIEANVVRTPPDGGMETGTMEVLDSFTSPSITDRANDDGTGLMLSNIISMSLDDNCSGVADLKIGRYGSLGSDKELGHVFGDSNVSFNATDVPHYHTFTENSDGTITIGGVSSTPGNFKISATKKYIDDVAKAHKTGGESAYVVMHKLTGNETPAKTPTKLEAGSVYQFYPLYKTQNGGNTSAPADVLDANSKWVETAMARVDPTKVSIYHGTYDEEAKAYNDIKVRIFFDGLDDYIDLPTSSFLGAGAWNAGGKSAVVDMYIYDEGKKPASSVVPDDDIIDVDYGRYYRFYPKYHAYTGDLYTVPNVGPDNAKYIHVPKKISASSINALYSYDANDISYNVTYTVNLSDGTSKDFTGTLDPKSAYNDGAKSGAGVRRYPEGDSNYVSYATYGGECPTLAYDTYYCFRPAYTNYDGQSFLASVNSKNTRWIKTPPRTNGSFVYCTTDPSSKSNWYTTNGSSLAHISSRRLWVGVWNNGEVTKYVEII